MEKAYMDCAADCGIIVPETKLMPSSVCAGYFAVKRFDRRKTDGHIERRHMLTAAAILEVDWRTAAMDYHTLMKLTKILSLDNREDLEQMYRRMCFQMSLRIIAMTMRRISAGSMTNRWIAGIRRRRMI